MSDAQLLVMAAVLTPIVILGLAGIARGYHMHIKVWRGGNGKDDNGND